MKTTILFVSVMIFSLPIINSLYPQCQSITKQGEGTYYPGVDGSASGNCGLPVRKGDKMHCALNSIDYNESNSCGACIEVTGKRGKAIVKVVDRCPECKSGDVDLTREAFAKVANPLDGRVPIRWKFVPCPLNNASKKIKIHFKEGSSRYWTSIQIRDARDGINKLEYSRNNSWVVMKREYHNYFTENSGIPSPMTLRVTSKYGQRLIFPNIRLNLNKDFDTNKQFAAPANCNPHGTAFKKITVPGRVEAEFFNNGKNGVAYKDHDMINRGKAFRNTEVDLGTTNDANGNYFVGWTKNGEWLKYTINVAQTNFYNLNFRTGTINDNARIRIFIDGKPLNRKVKLKNTGSWLKFTTNTLPKVRLTKGEHVVQILIDGTPFTFNYWNAVLYQTDKQNITNNIIIYPNPVSSILTIQNANSWILMDINGKIVKQGTSSNTDVSDLPSGLYILKTDNTILKINKI